jgi:hypothetical protein
MDICVFIVIRASWIIQCLDKQTFTVSGKWLINVDFGLLDLLDFNPCSYYLWDVLNDKSLCGHSTLFER